MKNNNTREKHRYIKKVGNTRIIPITTRIVVIFTISILITSFVSNYINLAFNRAELVKMMKELLVKDLKEIYDYSNIQYEIYQYTKDEPDAYQSSMEIIAANAARQIKNRNSVAFGLKITGDSSGDIVFLAANIRKTDTFKDGTALRRILREEDKGVRDGTITFYLNAREYFGVYKYIPKWGFYLVRAEELNEFYQGSRRIFRDVLLIIGLITLCCTLIGIYFIRHITRFIDRITDAIMDMLQTQRLELIDLKGATNDNITLLGMALNTLSSTTNNILVIFRRFVNQDVAIQAYRDKIVPLEGTQKELTVLFSDIKSFTYMTEVLGTDIINVLNLYYHRAIRAIFQRRGLIGTIMGDAVLAVFGIEFEDESEHWNKSYQAVLAGYEIQEAARLLRAEMEQRRMEIIQAKGSLSEEEEEIYRAVLVEVGVGIDGGNVFYGNIGSYERMAHTVIGDNVNVASRMEGLTRIYKVPLICTEYVKIDIEENQPGHDFYFLELDTVQVKGKTTGQKIFWPIPRRKLNRQLYENITKFENSLSLYYKGRWQEAHRLFEQIDLPVIEEFLKRTRGGEAPENWSGIWNIEMK